MDRNEGLSIDGDGSIRYAYLETSHSSSHSINDGGISDGGVIWLYEGDGRGGFRSQETSFSSSCNLGFFYGDQSVDDGRYIYLYQETSHSSSR